MDVANRRLIGSWARSESIGPLNWIRSANLPTLMNAEMSDVSQTVAPSDRVRIHLRAARRGSAAPSWASRIARSWNSCSGPAAADSHSAGQSAPRSQERELTPLKSLAVLSSRSSVLQSPRSAPSQSPRSWTSARAAARFDGHPVTVTCQQLLAWELVDLRRPPVLVRFVDHGHFGQAPEPAP